MEDDIVIDDKNEVIDDDFDLDDIDDEGNNDESFDLDGDSDEDIATDDDGEDLDDIEVEDGEGELDGTKTDDDDAETGDNGREADKDDAADKPATDDRDNEIAELKRQLAEKNKELDNVRNLGKETLQKMGVNVDSSVEEAFERANAESEGISVEEYRKARAASAEAQATEAQAKRQAFEELAASDLSTLKKSFPDLLENKHISDCFDTFEKFAQFGKLRDSGIDPKTAYIAVNGDKVISKQADAQRKDANNGNGKSHLRSAVAKPASSDEVVMSRQTMQEWKDLFPHLSEKEIKALYKQSL